jgi:ABC-type multidrug transport system fused ATPase/permease subunit
LTLTMLSAFLSGRTSLTRHLITGLWGSVWIGLLAVGLSSQEWTTGQAATRWSHLAAVVLAVALLWAATWIWTAWHWATLAVEAGRGLVASTAAMGFSITLALLTTLFTGDRLHSLLFTWNGMTMAAYSPVGVRYLPAQDGEARGQLLLFGDLGPGSAERLAQALAQYPHVRRLNLQSHRGLVTEAMDMARQIQQRDMDTAVQGRCVGPCALVWMAGAARMASPQDALGFHQTYAPILPFLRTHGRADDQVYRFYTSLKVPPTTALAMVSAPAHQPWVPDHATLIDLGVNRSTGR